MKKWDATMPRTAAKDGHAHVVVSFKRSTGMRTEFTGQLLKDDADKLFQLAIEMVKNTKEST